MYTLDGALLQECGLRDLEEVAQNELLAMLYDDLEYRVGRLLSDNLSNEQLAEFNDIIDADEATVSRWIARHAPEYESDPLYRRIAAASPASEPAHLRAEFASAAWLALNRPDYRDRVAEVFAALRSELTSDPVGTITRLQRERRRAG